MAHVSFDDDVKALPSLGAGLGYRAPLSALFLSDLQAENAPKIQNLEVVAEHFFYDGVRRPKLFGERPVMMHSLDLSLGSDDALDENYLEKLFKAQDALKPVWLSDHLCFTQSGGIELGHLNPIPPTKAVAARVAAKIREVQERTQALFLLENISTHLSISGDLRAAEFYRRVCDDADCGMLLDVTNILVNCHNFKKDPLAYLDELDLSRVVQLHVVGYSTGPDGTRFDSHAENISDDVFALCKDVIQRAPVKAVIIERDGNYPRPEQLLGELDQLQNLLGEKKRAADEVIATPTTKRITLKSPEKKNAVLKNVPQRVTTIPFLDELALLLSDQKARSEFSQNARDYAKNANLDAEDEERLAQLVPKELSAQADVLLKKRFHEVMDLLPESKNVLGSSFPTLFQDFAASTSWPTGHLRHLKDAVAFTRWLQFHHPDSFHGQEAVRVDGHLLWRMNKKRWTAKLSAGKDTGPLLHLVVALHLFRTSVLLLFPLPWPRFLSTLWSQSATSTSTKSKLDNS